MHSQLTFEAMSEVEVGQMSAASLAYLGDVVLELMVRRALVCRAVRTPSVEALKYVTAGAQSDALELMTPHLTEEESAQFKRGRNSVHSGVPKNATPSQYRRATGLETLFGYLHLTGQSDRAEELFKIGFPTIWEDA